MTQPALIRPLTTHEFRDLARGLTSGFDTSFRSGNRRLVLPSGGVTVIAGSPGEGKTSLMLNLLRNLLLAYPEKRFYFFSFEESALFLAIKLLMIGSDVELHRNNFDAFLEHFRMASWDPADERNPRLAHALEEFDTWIKTGRLCLLSPDTDLFSLTRELRTSSEPPTGAVFIDYIQKVRLPPMPHVRERYQQLQLASEDLRDLASCLGVPVVVGAQLSRSAKGWPPSLDHIRESSDIGQDATLVLALRREKRAEGQAETLKVHVVKDRRGPAHFDFAFAFKGATYRVDSLSAEEAKKASREARASVERGGVWLPLSANAPEPFVAWQ